MYWKRAIILMDMNSFFAAVEQLDHPEWRGLPVAVTNGNQGSCIITSSYEARAYGIKTGMPLFEARLLCPDLIQTTARHERYEQISSQIIQALYSITPDIEIFSIDEAFLDVTHCQKYWGTPEVIGRLTRDVVRQASGLGCSIGVSGDKTTAKYAAKRQKPNGLTIIPPWLAREALHDVPVTELCGIAKGIGRFLAQYGVYTCGDMEKLPIGILARRFGNLGRRIWFMCQGADPEPVKLTVKAPRSLGHSKVMPPGIKDKTAVFTYLHHMTEKVATRLRHNKLEGQTLSVGVRDYELGYWLGDKIKLASPTNDGRILFSAAKKIINLYWHGEPLSQIYATILDPQPIAMQLDLFETPDLRCKELNRAIDTINHRFGKFTIAPGDLLNHNMSDSGEFTAFQLKRDLSIGGKNK